MSKKKFRDAQGKQAGGYFLKFPWEVIDSRAYRGLSPVARSLLIDIARQYTSHNNGKLVACDKYLKPLGWKSHGTITRNLKQLVEAGLLCETRKGARPNRAAWFALTWCTLDVVEGLDIDPRHYKVRPYLEKPGAMLILPERVEKPVLAPSRRVAPLLSIPSERAMH